jgi:hypothetical protein
VCDQHHRRLRFGIQLDEQVDHARPRFGIETASGLIGEEERWSVRERPRQADALLLATRELHWVVVFPVDQADTGEQVSRPLEVATRPPAGAQLQGNEHVLECGQRGEELKRLEHEPHPLRAKRRAAVLVQRTEILAVDPDGPLRGPIEPGEQPQKRGLAAPRRPHDGQEPLCFDG